jgi:hypothetical protein
LPSQDLIIQGLRGPRLLLQGLGRGGSTSSFTGSGGMAFGGVAVPTLSASVACAGGLSLGGQAVADAINYRIYMNQGQGDPINYDTPVATVAGDSWVSATLDVPGDYRLGVRAFDASTGLEEQNIDAVVELRLDAGGNDATAVPSAPMGLRAFPLAGGAARVEWASPGNDPRGWPLGFHVYRQLATGPGGPSLVSTVPWSLGRLGRFSATLTGLADGMSYSVSVSAFNAVGESDAAVVLVNADSTPPDLVDDLAAVATNQES